MAPKRPSPGDFGKLSFGTLAVKQGVISRPLNSSPGHCCGGFGSLCLHLPLGLILQEELESYPLDAIVRCDAVMPRGRSRSLLLLVCQEPERAQPDVHFFQGLLLGVSGRGSMGLSWRAGGRGGASMFGGGVCGRQRGVAQEGGQAER